MWYEVCISKSDLGTWFQSEWENSKFKVLEYKLVNNTIYGAINDTSTNEVFCAVYEIRVHKDIVLYKQSTEHEGPIKCECPISIFGKLTPLDDKNDPIGAGRKWRARVLNRENI